MPEQARRLPYLSLVVENDAVPPVGLPIRHFAFEAGFFFSKEILQGVSQVETAFSYPVQARLGGNLDEVITSLGDLAPLFEEAKLFARL